MSAQLLPTNIFPYHKKFIQGTIFAKRSQLSYKKYSHNKPSRQYIN